MAPLSNRLLVMQLGLVKFLVIAQLGVVDSRIKIGKLKR
jgi:hypothetical protein